MEQKNIMNKKSKKKLSDYLQMDKKDQTASLVALVFLACIALGYFALVPIVNNYKMERIKLEDAIRKEDALQRKQISLKGLERDISERNDFIARTEDAMPTTAQVPELLVTLSKLSSDNSLYMTNFSPKEEAAIVPGTAAAASFANLEYNSLSVDFNISGSYLNMKQFLKDVETNIRPINIKSVSISGGGEISKDNSSETLIFSVSAETYYKKLQ